MTAHIISHGIQPSLHPGVLRKMGSIISIQAPMPATARRIFAYASLIGCESLSYFAGEGGHFSFTMEVGL